MLSLSCMHPCNPIHHVLLQPFLVVAQVWKHILWYLSILSARYVSPGKKQHQQHIWGVIMCPVFPTPSPAGGFIVVLCFFGFFLGGKTYPEIHHLSQLSRWLKNLTEEFSKYESNYYQQFLYAKFISISNYQLSRQNLWWAAECQSTRSPSPVNHLTVQYNKIRLEWHLW